MVQRRAGGALEPAGRALELAGRVSEQARSALEPVGRALEPAGRPGASFEARGGRRKKSETRTSYDFGARSSHWRAVPAAIGMTNMNMSFIHPFSKIPKTSFA